MKQLTKKDMKNIQGGSITKTLCELACTVGGIFCRRYLPSAICALGVAGCKQVACSRL